MKKVALVTGASAGIGWDIAEYLNNKGFSVIAAARRLEKMEALKSQGIYTVRMDVSESESIDQALAEIRSNVGEIDILVNNAGVMFMGPAECVPMEEIKKLYNINFFGLIELTQKCLPYMRQQEWGRILNVTSVGGVTSMPFNSVYQSGKFALEGWTRSLKQEVRRYGIGVSTIRPGSIKSEIFEGTAVYQKEEDLPWVEDVYRESFAKARAFIDETQRKGASPEEISKIVYQAISATSPKVSYTAPFGTKILVALMIKLLPETVRDRLIEGIHE